MLGAERKLSNATRIVNSAEARADRPPRCLLSKADSHPPQPPPSLHHASTRRLSAQVRPVRLQAPVPFGCFQPAIDRAKPRTMHMLCVAHADGPVSVCPC